ncbi:hypothetical protein PIIN_06222 [Serendipita indica DSM 11827]|uniref:G domain-containing protein n=1 Tax=Serendipita indica (strain DSM 11827) TaxID=1109443 RepID=G4TLU5_SERID|nr:hypothetical protein PIIN_06222 [Serendipita indica DSM 11827]
MQSLHVSKAILHMLLVAVTMHEAGGEFTFKGLFDHLETLFRDIDDASADREELTRLRHRLDHAFFTCCINFPGSVDIRRSFVSYVEYGQMDTSECARIHGVRYETLELSAQWDLGYPWLHDESLVTIDSISADNNWWSYKESLSTCPSRSVLVRQYGEHSQTGSRAGETASVTGAFSNSGDKRPVPYAQPMTTILTDDSWTGPHAINVLDWKQVHSVTKKHRIIILYGETGTGKSSFINAVIGFPAARVVHNLQGSKSLLESFRIALDRKELLLVEIREKSEFSQWFKAEYGPLVAGVIYFHRITDTRTAHMGMRSRELVTQILAPYAPVEILLTTMWDVPATAGQIQSERELILSVAPGAYRFERMDNTIRQTSTEIIRSARQILRQILSADEKQRENMIQVDNEGKNSYVASGKLGNTGLNRAIPWP